MSASTGTGLRALAVIPARGGSKRIPRKNIRPFHGVPLLARTVETLRKAAVFDHIVVSTDDPEIRDVALAAGAEVPFVRPAELATDTAPTIPVIAHAIEALATKARHDYVCCAYPAAVLLQPADYRAALDLLAAADADYVFTATKYAYPIQRALRALANGGCEMFQPEHRGTRSQDLEPAFHDAGQFYWGRRDAWLASRPIFSDRSRMFLLSANRIQDIDTEEDWARAELIYELARRERAS